MKNIIKITLLLTILMSFSNIIPNATVIIYNDGKSKVDFKCEPLQVMGMYTTPRVFTLDKNSSKTITLDSNKVEEFEKLHFKKHGIARKFWTTIELEKEHNFSDGDIAVIIIKSVGKLGRLIWSKAHDIKIIKDGENKHNNVQLIKKAIKKLRG